MARREADGVGEQLFQEGALYLLDKGGYWVSRKELQEKLKIGKSTACRLLEALSIRLPLEEKQGSGNRMYYRLPEGSAKSVKNQMVMAPTLTADDRRMLSVLIRFAESSHLYGTMVTTLRKHLVAASGGNGKFYPVFSASSVRQKLTPRVKEALPLLFQAIDEKHAVLLTYQSPTAETTKQYVIHPIGIFSQDGNLYLYSYNPEHGNGQVNACARIHKVELLEEKCAIPKGMGDITKLCDPFGIAMDAKETTVVVHIGKRQAFYEQEKEWPEGTIMEEQEDGSMQMTITTKNRSACKRWILSLGDQGKVLSPDDFVQEVGAEIKKTSELYAPTTAL